MGAAHGETGTEGAAGRTGRMIQARERSGLCLALGLCAWSVPAGAQDLVAPRVRSLPGVQVPAGIEVPDSGVVQVRVRIDPDGRAVVEKCDGGRALCDLGIEAIAKADFDPATGDVCHSASWPR